MGKLAERTSELENLFRRLDRGEWCAVVAPPFSGRTTLAKLLETGLTKRHPKWKIGHLAFRRQASVNEAAREIIESLGEAGGREEGLPSAPVLADQLALKTGALGSDFCLILDGLDALPDQVLGLIAAELRRYRNAFSATAKRKLHCVLFGGSKLFYQTRPTSPLGNIVETITMSDLTPLETVEVLSSWTDASISLEAGRSLFRLTAGHPYFVRTLADRLGKEGQTITTSRLEAAASQWKAECLTLPDISDPCLMQTLDYLQSHRRAFRAILQLLDASTPISAGQDVEELVMSGAVIQRGGELALRGEMLADGLRLFFDPLRRADFWALHGDWEKSKTYFEQVSRQITRQRRAQEMNVPGRGIMDLCMGLVASALECQKLDEAECRVAKLGLYLFGADRSALWRLDAVPGEIIEVATKPEGQQFPPRPAYAQVAGAAARNHAALTLEADRGIIQGIGINEQRTRWSLELYFEEGIPAGGWVERNLRYVEPTLSMILDRARQRERAEDRLKQQRALIHDINRNLQRTNRVDDVFGLIVDGIKDQLKYECAQLSLVFPTEKKIRAVRSNGAFTPIRELTIRDLNGPDVLAVVVREKKARNVPDCEDYPNSHCDKATIDISLLKSSVVLPLIDGDKVVGVLQVGHSARKGAFDQEDIDLLQPLADCAAITIRTHRERAAFIQGFDAAGYAVALVDASGLIESCNTNYANFFKAGAGRPSIVRAEGDETNAEPLVNLAFKRKTAVNTVREIGGRKVPITAVSLQDALGRSAGGIEIASTEGSLHGLTEALAQMLTMADELHLAQAIVDCLCQQFGYSRARYYRFDPVQNCLVSVAENGLDSERAVKFAAGKLLQQLPEAGKPAPGFECLKYEKPLIIVRSDRFAEDLEKHQVVLDSRDRRVYLIDPPEVWFLDEVDKTDLSEWLDLPVISGGEWLGKISIDRKGNQRLFELDDIELLGLFGRWAGHAFARVKAIDHAGRVAELVSKVRLAPDREGLESMALDFLLTITAEREPGFNRAILFLREPHSAQLRGVCCHGAATGENWKRSIAEIQIKGNRREFIEKVLKQRESGEGESEEDRRRLEALRRYVVAEQDENNPLARAAEQRRSVFVKASVSDLLPLYHALGWEPARAALVCPLIHQAECEGLIYVDRAFDSRELKPEDQALLETLSFHLAAIARPLRMAVQLRAKILSLSHKSISPLASVRALAEALPEVSSPEERARLTSVLVAESQRASDAARQIIRVSAAEVGGLKPTMAKIDVVEVLKDRIQPYITLLEMDDFETELTVPRSPVWIQGDTELLGDAFAELCDNAKTAISAGAKRGEPAVFCVSCRVDTGSAFCEILFTNAGHPVPEALRSRLFQQFESGGGGTGLGLWLIQKILLLHHGEIEYKQSAGGDSCFRIGLPLQKG